MGRKNIQRKCSKVCFRLELSESPHEYRKWERHSRNLAPHGFREAFLGHNLEVLQPARTFPGTEQQGMGMQPVSLGRVRSRARQGEDAPGGPTSPPPPDFVALFYLFIISFIYLLVHSFLQ